MSKPIECPFCHKVNSYYEVNEWNKGYIVCHSCGATGPKVEAKRGANSKAASLWKKAAKQRGECEMEIEDEIEDMCGEHYVYFIGWTCSKCGNRMTSMYEGDAPKFCPECGAKVRKVVKR